MLYVYFGDDVSTARAKAQATITSLVAKNPDALYVRITPDTAADYSITELTESQALFKSEYLVLLDSILTTEQGEVFLDHVKELAASPHAFFLLEGKLLAPVRKKLEKHAQKVNEFSATDKKTAASFNSFLLTDALGARNKKQLWSLFREAKLHGAGDEELHGILFWMYKSLLLAQASASAEEAGMKQYPYTKAKQYCKNFTTTELAEQTHTCATLPQLARRKGVSLEVELERFILQT